MIDIQPGDAAQVVLALLALFGTIRLMPHLRARVSLVREREAAIADSQAAKAQLAIAEGTVQTLRDNAEGWRESMERVSGEMERVTGELTELRAELRAQASELADVKHRLFVAVDYIGKLIQRTAQAPIPPIPDALRDDLGAIAHDVPSP